MFSKIKLIIKNSYIVLKTLKNKALGFYTTILHNLAVTLNVIHKCSCFKNTKMKIGAK